MIDENAAVRPVRAASVASLVADKLRDRILSGELSDGRLPKEETLRAEFGVGKPAMREAMRILEAEGLVTVVRGNRGGAVIHAPKPTNSAYALGLVLAARKVRTLDVALALRALEPACAELCAKRSDRHREVVPTLAETHARSKEALDDFNTVTALFRRFHEQIVDGCGNETLKIVAGALEALWSSHVGTRTAEAARHGRKRPKHELRASIDDHARILDRIRKGDSEGVRLVLSQHLDRVQAAPSPANNRPIEISTLRQSLGL